MSLNRHSSILSFPYSFNSHPLSPMLLIDGYNLLHVTDLFGSGELAGTLQGSREALLAFLADRLAGRERERTTIVFDAAGAPPGLPDQVTFAGIDVRYSRGYADADTLIEELIRAWRGPKELTVVSSDHRVQRAARSRGARYVDSEKWHAALRRRRSGGSSSAGEPAPAGAAEPPEFWIEQFADEAFVKKFTEQEAKLKRPSPKPHRQVDKAKATSRSKKKRQAFGEGLLDPFPPGYADDLAKELQRESKKKDR